MEQKILVVDDDVSLTTMIQGILSQQGFIVTVANTAEDGVRQAFSSEPNLVLLDVMVPNMGGWEVCRRLRELTDEMPILFLTALGDTEHVVRGLDMGADDYLVKPFEASELLARVKAHLRRASKNQKLPERLVYGDGDLVIDLPSRSVKAYGEEVGLTPREFDVFACLAANPGRVITTQELVKKAWGAGYGNAPHNLKPYIHYLRKKIEKTPVKPRWIKTARGVGYRFADE